ncbi:MAG: chromosome segregation protein SMC, partial [Pseudomonadota bacterium]
LAETTGAHNALAQSAQAAAADRRARETEHDERQRACADLQDRAKRLDAERAELIAAAPQDDTGALEAQVADAETARGEAAEAIAAREQDLATRGQARDAAADAARTAAGDAAALTQEIATLERLLTVSTDESGDRAVDLITVADGFEKALAAALGDDLEAAVGTEAGTYWRALSDGDDYSGDPELPDGAAPLADRIEAPPELARRLRQIGLVDAADGADMQARLAPGQALISEAGDLWRWDGLVATASAPSPAAVRLAERNRLAALRPKLVAATAAAATAEADRATKAAAAAKSASDLNAARAALSEREQARETLRSKLLAGRQAQLGHETRLAALDDLVVRATDDIKAAQSRLAETTAAIADLPPQDHLAPQIEAAATALTAAQTKVAEDRTALAALKQAGLARDAQLATARNDDARWAQRLKSSADQIARLGERAEAVAEQLIHAQAHPSEIKSRQDKLAGAIAEAESARKTSADKLAEAETALRSATSALKRAQEAVAASREEKARAETRLDAALTRLVGTVQQIADTFETTPEACATLAQLDTADTANLPDIETSERKLQKLRSDRDRLGGVNLQAGEELETIEADYEKLDAERADVEDAVAKLRAGIAQLNREGRKRLQEAFTSVNREFSNLFRTLFGGGEAHLELIEGDDPLEGGLEIIAKPPGKKPTTLSLLSGGEQTLTALSLIFAVFLTNPSPICVLD